jgi:hypothetical protein
MGDWDGLRAPSPAIHERRRTLARIGLAEDGTSVLLAMPGGVEDAPLGTRCAVCGSRAEGRDLLLMLIDVHRPGGDSVRRFLCVHPQCTRHLDQP